MTDGRSALHGIFAALGVSSEEVEAAEENGTLLGLAAERFLLPGERQFDMDDVASRCGSDREALARLWLALGFPQSGPEKVYTDDDVDIMRTFLRDGAAVISDYTVHEARVVSASLARIAEVFVDETWDQHFSAGQSQLDALSEMAPSVDLERVERLLLHLLRRHIVAGIYRRSALHDHAARHGTPSMAVGFADLAGYSSLSRGMSDSELTGLVVAFEEAAYDVVVEVGGRVVKTLGDGVIYTSDAPAPAADIALRLAALGGDELPPVGVGLGWGPVLIRQGDCFGPTVNLVSRVVSCSAGGEVTVDPAMAAELAGDDRFGTTSLGVQELKSFGPVELWRLERS